MPLPFEPIQNAVPGTLVQSEVLTYTGPVTDIVLPPSISTVLELADFKVIVNGVDVFPGSTATLNPDDTIQAQGTAPAGFDVAAYGAIVLDGEGYVPFAVMTASDTANAPPTVGPDSTQSDYYEGYVPVAPENSLLTVSAATSFVVKTPIEPVASTVPGTIGDGKSYLYSTDIAGGYVHRIDPSDGTVVQSISVNTPYGVTYTPILSNVENVVPKVLVTSPSTNTVLVLDSDNEVEHTLQVGAGPHGICGSPSEEAGHYSFWVACTDADKVQRWKSTGTAPTLLFEYNLPSGSKPYHVASDKDDNAWVTCLGSDKVAKCSADNSVAVAYVDVGPSPMDIRTTDSYAYVACSGSNVISAIGLASSTVTSLSTIQNPTHLEVTSARMLVGSFNTGVMASYTMPNGINISNEVLIEESNRMFEGMTASFDSVKVYALNQHADLPDPSSSSGTLDPSEIDLSEQENARPSSEITSNSILISSEVTDIPIFVPGGVRGSFEVEAVVNSVPSGNATTVSKEDAFSVRVNTPTDVRRIPVLYLPVMYKGGMTMWIVRMSSAIKTRVGGWIKGG